MHALHLATPYRVGFKEAAGFPHQTIADSCQQQNSLYSPISTPTAKQDLCNQATQGHTVARVVLICSTMAEVSLNNESERSWGHHPLESESVFVNRRMDFHVARNSFNGIGNGSSNGFQMVNLNPNTGFHQDSISGKRIERSEYLESGFDPELGLEITFRKIGAGLRNLGNTCFLNSVLQCLTYTEPLAAYLQSGKHQNSCRTAGFCALCAIQKHVRRALQSTGRILEPKDLVSNLRCISRSFRNSRQEDAHEYMVNLLESMHKCCLPSGVPSESPGAYDKSLVHKIFGGRLRSQVKCMQCSFCSNKFDPFLDLSLEIMKADSLQKALCHFTAKEQLDGGAKQYQCQQCKQKVKALKQLTVYKAPHVLAVHLKRFGSHVYGQKIDKRIAFGPTLDLKPFVTGPYEGDLNYTLYGVLVHAGWSTHSGHYYCFVRTSSGTWYSLDDNRVVQVNERKVLEQKAYMLFYFRERRNFIHKKSVDILHTENLVKSKLDVNSNEKVPNGLTKRNTPVATPPKRTTPSEKTPMQNGNGTETVMPTSNFFNVNDYGSRSQSCLTGKGFGDELCTVKISDCNGSSGFVHGRNLSAGTMLHDFNVPKDSRHKGGSSNIGSVLSTSEEKVKETANKPAEEKQKGSPDYEMCEMEAPNENNAKFSNHHNTQDRPVGGDGHKSFEAKKSGPLTISNKSNQPKLKIKRKHLKIQAATMLLSFNIIYSGAVSLKRKRQKSRKRLPMPKSPGGLKHPLGLNAFPSDTGLLKMVTNDSGGHKMVSNNAENETQASSSTVNRPGNSGEQRLEDKIVAPRDGSDVSLSERSETSIIAAARQISHIGDEWDEEYDRGKRKKIRISKMVFGGPNLFQKIAASKRKRREGRPSFGNSPFRI